MFSGYKIKNNTLYLEINFDYEFGTLKKESKNIIVQIKEYIKNNNINKLFNKIVITCGGIIIGSIIFSKPSNNINENNIKYVPNINNMIVYAHSSKTDIINKVNNSETDIINTANNIVTIDDVLENNVTNTTSTNTDIVNKEVKEVIPVQNSINVHRTNGQIISIELEEYIIGVVASEMPASFNIEALKAQSVIARTYALKARESGKILTDTVSTQTYIDTNEMSNKWGSSFDTYYNKIKNAVLSTSGEYLSYDGNYIEALYHSTNNGKTESSLDVFGYYYPYLISVNSQYDKYASSYLRNINMDIDTFSSKLNIDFNNDSTLEIISYTDGNNIKEINIGGKTFTGINVRELLSLRSADFDIEINENSVNITTRGFGHGVGMSQYGANGMANNGYNYLNILYHYYPGTTLKK